jgi:nitrogen regulatory protein PII
MKMVIIAYGEAIDEEVMEALAAAGAENYTKWTGVQGKGTTSGPHLASHVWPKQNNVLAVAVEDEQAAHILEGVKELRRQLGEKGVKAFVLPIDAVT